MLSKAAIYTLRLEINERYAPNRVHHLKTWNTFFVAVWDKSKLFEIRKNDRAYKKGDVAVLWDYCPQTDEYSGNYVVCRIGYVLDYTVMGVSHPSSDSDIYRMIGLQPGYCIWSIIDPIFVLNSSIEVEKCK